jgi:hypothetical protein
MFWRLGGGFIFLGAAEGIGKPDGINGPVYKGDSAWERLE